MHLIDVVILAILTVGLIRGWLSGFFMQLASLLGFFLGLFAAYVSYESLGNYFAPHIGASETVAGALAFIIVWLLVPILLGFVASLLTKTFKTLKLGLLNRVAGMVLAFLQFLILTSCLLNALTFFHLIDDENQQSSLLYNPIKGVLGLLYDKVDGAAPQEKSANFFDKLGDAISKE